MPSKVSVGISINSPWPGETDRVTPRGSASRMPA